MNLFLIIYLPILIYMFSDFKKAFLIFVFMKVFLNQNINIVNMPGVPILKLELFMNICFAVYFMFMNKNNKIFKEKFPLKTAFNWCFFSIIISTIFSSVGFSNAITRALQDIFNNYIYIYILWYVIRDKKDIIFLLKGFTYIFIFLGVYGIYEKLSGMNNPLIEYEKSLNNETKVLDYNYGIEGRLGMGRVRSAIIHAIGFGAYLSVIISFFLYIQIKFKQIWKQKFYLKIALFVLSFTCLFYTNSRSPFTYLFVALLPFFNLNNKRTYSTILILFIGIIASWTFIEPYLLNIISIFDSSVASEVGGSDTKMRMLQILAAIRIFSESPIIGLGIKSMDLLLESGKGLLGGESIWIWLLIERGILGCISHIILLFSIAKMGKGNTKYFVWASTLGWLLLTTATSTPGCEISFFMTIMIITTKIEPFFSPTGETNS